MRFKQTVYTFFCVIVFANESKAQSLDNNDNRFFDLVIDTFVHNRDHVAKNRKTEITILIMEVDSSGKISSIHLFSDEKRRDRTYEILSQLKPEIFHSRKFEKCSGKLIFLPIITRSKKSNEKGYPDTILRNIHTICEDKNVIWAKTIDYQILGYTEGHVIKVEGRLDSTLYKKP